MVKSEDLPWYATLRSHSTRRSCAVQENKQKKTNIFPVFSAGFYYVALFESEQPRLGDILFSACCILEDLPTINL